MTADLEAVNMVKRQPKNDQKGKTSTEIGITFISIGEIGIIQRNTLRNPCIHNS